MKMKQRWWIAVLFLVLAALACDEPYYDPMHVREVEADPDTPGRVYAAINSYASADSIYRSDDYGQTWAYMTEKIDVEGDTLGVRMDGGDTLYNLYGQPMWTFPRSTYRFFFLQDDYGKYFKLPYNPSSSTANGTLYVAMGTEGVLTFAPSGESYLSAEGIEELNPLPLTITDAPTILGIITLALLIPPLPLIHAYLISRVWMRIMPSGEAWGKAILLSLVLSLLAAIAITIWLTDARTDYYGIVAVMSAITVISGAGITHAIVPESRPLTLWAGLVSAIVPLGVAAVWAGWLFIIPLVTTYAIYRRMYTRLSPPDEEVAPGQADWLALRSLGILAACTMTVFIAVWVIVSWLRYIDWLILIGLLAGGWWSVRRISRHVYKPLSEAVTFQTLKRRVLVATVLCYAFSIFLVGAVFWGQFAAYGWFKTLLVPR